MFTDLYAMATTSRLVSIHEYKWTHQYVTLFIDDNTLLQADLKNSPLPLSSVLLSGRLLMLSYRNWAIK